MTFKPEAFRELTNWIFLAIGVVLTVLLPRLVRGLKRLFSKEVPEIPSRPSTIYDSGTVTARGAHSAREAISDSGTVYVKVTPSAAEATSDGGTVYVKMTPSVVEAFA